MAEKYDVIVIGAGVLGCFAARHLAAYDLKTAVLEQREDVCTGITRANSGIIYRGYDQHPDSLKAGMCVRASQHFSELCRQLDVTYSQCGLMMLSFGPRGDASIDKKYRHGKQLGIQNLHVIDSRQIYEQEPFLAPGAKKALYSEDTCVVDPWDLGIAAYENAAANGVSFLFNEKVTALCRDKGQFRIETEHSDYTAAKVLCCAGLSSDVLWEMAAKPRFRIIPKAADFIVFDVMQKPLIRHVISVEPEEYGEGLTMIPTVSGNLLLGPTRRAMEEPDEDQRFETSQEGLLELLEKAGRLLPDLPADKVIRSFGAVRPNPYYVESSGNGYEVSSRSINDFLILEEQGLFSLAGIKTPGLTCADELGSYITEKIVASFEQKIPEKASFDPVRKGILTARQMSDQQRMELAEKDPDYARILCRCKGVTCAEVKEAIRRGALTGPSFNIFFSILQ